MQYKCVCSIITRRHGAALGMRGRPMPRLYMSVGGEGRPDRAWMAAFVRVLIARFREVWRLPAPPHRGPRSGPPGCARRSRCARRTSHLSTSGPGSPRRRAGPAGRRAPGTLAAGPSPSPAFRHPPPRRATRGAPPSLLSPTSACLLLSTDVSRSTVAVPSGEPRCRRQLCAHSGRERAGKAVPIRTVAPRLGNAPSSPPRRPDIKPRERPGNRRRVASHARKPRRPCPIPCRMPAPSDPKPAPALLGRAGSHAGGRPARAATLFRVLRPMRSAREQREKLPSGDFYIHARLRFLPCRRARAACDSRDARHATGAGLRV